MTTFSSRLVVLGLFLAEIPAESPALEWTKLGALGGLAAAMFYFYRQDRKDSEKRFEELSKDFRNIVENNTTAITKLNERIGAGIARCPMAENKGD